MPATPPPTYSPITDPARLAAVLETELLDTAPEPAFDDLTRIAAQMTGAPFAFATLVDEVRSFWKSAFGLPADAPQQNTVDESFCQYVIRSESELIVVDAAADPRTRANPSIEAMGVRAWAGFPIRGPHGDVLGSFCVVDTVSRGWSAAQLDVIRTLAAAASREIGLRASVRLEREARRKAELLAHALQQSLLPPALPNIPGLDIAARYYPAGTGIDVVGDFYDVFALRDRRWGFVIGDVCGKGVEAAKLAALARYTVAGSAMQHDAPADVLAQLNRSLLARGDVHVFLTAVYGTLTPCSNWCEVRVACAGHAPPIVRRADGTTALLEINGPLIGVIPEYAVDELLLRLEAGDAVVIYTDGVDEARNGSDVFGDTALLNVIRTADPAASAAELASAIEHAVLAFGNGVARDDIAILVIRVPPHS